ncbi:TPA: lipocalin-like domain-containing protein [Legionella pneumophila]|uniref:Lipocalin-like domain-containing protein n=1 Tax=Legionella pneumophila TaxID=446 RepID=A0AAN5KQL4_LEGPN|nr:lipocalin-like domain-containing protein [Legionella pneumophila]HAT1972416.1 lipocalin-like domain-containing protein [Legionella pneumophila]HEN4770076.1 lipocalin-like domain-containing protein [Legionella pneumophila]
MNITMEFIVGTWTLHTPKMQWLSNGSTIYPFGKDAVGFLCYLENE